MALTRKFLEGMGLTAEQVEAIIEEHVAVKSALEKRVSEAEDSAKDYDSLKKENEKLQKLVDDSAKDDDSWKSKFEKEHSDFEKFKKDIEGEKTKAAITKAYEKLLADAGVGEKHIKSILGVTDMSEMKLNEDGSLVDADKLTESITDKWSGFIPESTSTGTGAKIGNPPPSGNGGKYSSKDEIMKIKNTSERQQAIAENPELFGR